MCWPDTETNKPTGAGPDRVIAGRALSGTDLVLHELWPLGGPRAPGALHTGLLATLGLGTVLWALKHLALTPIFPDVIFELLVGISLLTIRPKMEAVAKARRPSPASPRSPRATSRTRRPYSMAPGCDRNRDFRSCRRHFTGSHSCRDRQLYFWFRVGMVMACDTAPILAAVRICRCDPWHKGGPVGNELHVRECSGISRRAAIDSPHDQPYFSNRDTFLWRHLYLVTGYGRIWKSNIKAAFAWAPLGHFHGATVTGSDPALLRIIAAHSPME